MKHIATVFLTLMLLVGVVGCAQQVEVKNQGDPASEEKETVAVTPESERQPIQVVESGYWFDEFGRGHYGVMLENSNQGWAATNFPYTVTGKDAAGNIVGSDTQYVKLLFANGKCGYGGQTTFAGAQTLEFQVTDSKKIWEQETTQQAELDNEIHIQNVHATADEYGDTTVSGELVNDTKGETSYPLISALFLAADGSIVGGCQGTVDTSPAGSTVPFSIPMVLDVPEYASIAAYVDFGIISQ